MTKIRLLSFLLYVLVVGLALFAWSCSSDDSDGVGVIRITVTDAPFDIGYLEEASITISKIELRHTDSVEGKPFVVVFEDSTRLDLLDLQNGVVEELAMVDVPVGDYDLVRIYVEEAKITLINGVSHGVKVPSGMQSGVKVFVNPKIHVVSGLTTELLLDFDLSRSFVAKGDSKELETIKGFNFKPVIRAINNSFAGRVEGYVKDSEGDEIPGSYVWLEKDTVVATTFSDSTGFYALIGIPEGTYSLFSFKEGFDTLRVDNIFIVASNKSEINIQLTKGQN